MTFQAIVRCGAGLGIAVSLVTAAPTWAAGEVDDTRLLAAVGDAKNWLMFGGNYTNSHFSALDQINKGTVGNLVPAWVYQTGKISSFQTNPLVVDGTMFISTPGSGAVALNAVTGEVVWQYDHGPGTPPSSRGLALGYGKVFHGTNDGYLVALSQGTGEVLWSTLIAQPEVGAKYLEELTPELRNVTIEKMRRLNVKAPPLVYNGLVIVGVSGAGFYSLPTDPEGGRVVDGVIGAAGEYGRRGYLVALDAESGEEVWRWYTTPEVGWEGEFVETAPDGTPLNRDIAAEKAAAGQYADAWRLGGGTLWMTPALDPDLGWLFLGTGNPSPLDYGEMRPGDNLYTNSLVALDANTGEMKWYYQAIPHDLWGRDRMSQLVLMDVPVDGQQTKAVGQAGKDGWFYIVDRLTGNHLYKSEPFVPVQNLFAQLTTETMVIAPGGLGGASWPPVSFNPQSGIVYVGAIHRPYSWALMDLGEDVPEELRFKRGFQYMDEEQFGTLTAIDTRAGAEIVWQVETPQPLSGGILATAGGLVFSGEGSGWFNAFDADTGERLWRFNAGAGVNAPPMSYEVDGVQYVTVAAGGSRVYGFPMGNSLYTFALLR